MKWMNQKFLVMKTSNLYSGVGVKVVCFYAWADVQTANFDSDTLFKKIAAKAAPAEFNFDLFYPQQVQSLSHL